MIDKRDYDRYERELRAMVARAGQDDPEAFAQVVGLLDTARTEWLRDAARELRRDRPVEGSARIISGYSWADLAAALGVTRSAAFQRFREERVGQAS